MHVATPTESYWIAQIESTGITAKSLSDSAGLDCNGII